VLFLHCILNLIDSKLKTAQIEPSLLNHTEFRMSTAFSNISFHLCVFSLILSYSLVYSRFLAFDFKIFICGLPRFLLYLYRNDIPGGFLCRKCSPMSAARWTITI